MSTRLTPHQAQLMHDVAAILARGGRAVTARRLRTMVAYDGGSASGALHVRAVGSASGLEHLAEKGYLRPVNGYSSRSDFRAFVLTDQGAAWWATRKVGA